MEKPTDWILIELEVTAVLTDPDVHMQGSLRITINGQKPYDDHSDIIDLNELLKSKEADGEYFIFSCCCGIPSCSGWVKGIQVAHRGDVTEWIDPNKNRRWLLEKNKIENDMKDIRNEATAYRQFFDDKDINYVGVGVNWE